MKLPVIFFKTFFLTVAFFSTLAIAVNAQEKAGLRGQVIDPFKAVVTGAKVTLSNTEFVLTTTTNEEGVFTFSEIIPGVYQLTVEADGFTIYKSEQINVSISGNTPLAVELAVGLGKDIEVAVDDGNNVNTDSGSNLNQTILKDRDLEVLPDDPEALAAALKALTTSPNALDGNGQFYVDGLENGRLPPKASIAQVRVNQNPLNAEFDRAGFNRVDITTKPGDGKIRGGVFFNFSDDSLVARNPFLGERFPYQTRLYGGTLSGAIVPNKSSYFIDLQKREEDNTTTINARILDADFAPTDFLFAAAIPVRFFTFSPRLDFQLNENNILNVRYAFTQNKLFNRGIGDFALPERAYSTVNKQNLFQIIETAILNPVTSNEFRLQLIEDKLNQNDDNTGVGIVVQDAFSAGGAGIGLAKTKTRRIELQNYITTIFRGHTMRFGVRLRGVSINDDSLSGSNGIFTFSGGIAPQLNSNNEIVLDGNGDPVLIRVSSLEKYRRTVLLRSLGLPAAEIRRRGGGASQLGITIGNPLVGVKQFDVGFFFQDEWRLRPNLNVGAGFRYENQTNISSNADFAPRVFFAWAPGKQQQPKMVIRGGFGIFYDRTGEQVQFQSRRFAENAQLRYFITDPTLLDLFPNVPSPSELTSFIGTQAITRVADDIQSPYAITFVGNVERELPHKVQAYIYAYTYRAHHTIRLRNINAPIPTGTGEIIRPFSNLGEVFYYESSGNFSLNQITFGLRKNFKNRSSLFTSYVYGKSKNDSETLPANSYNLDGEFGRSSFDTRHRFIFGGTFIIPRFKITLNPFIIANTGRPFNIVTGIDNNRDNIYTDRPAFADSATLPENLVVTRFGDFDIRPSADKKLIPRNYGQGPAFLSVNLGILRTFDFKIGADSTKQTGGSGAGQNPATAQKKADPRKITLTLSAQIQNLLNRSNLDVPNGNLSSPFFGQSVRIVPAFGSGLSDGFNRRLEVGARLNF